MLTIIEGDNHNIDNVDSNFLSKYMKNILNQVKEVVLSSRFKSFYWRTGMMVVALIVNQAQKFITTTDINPQYVVILGLIFGEVSKEINNRLTK